MEYKDYYRLLGVPRTANADAIKRAYRKLAGEFHPDKNPSKEAESRFKEINEAHEVLSDAEKRSAYDALGADWKSGQRFRPPPGWQGGRRGAHAGMGEAGFSDFFSTLFGGAGGPAGAGMGGFAPEAEDSRDTLHVTLEESFHGGQRRVQLAGGRTLEVRIPQGVTAGQTIRLSRQGRFGGDLLLDVQFITHARYSVQGRDLSCALPLAPWEAALGASVSIATLGGDVELRLPPGQQTGRKLRLKGRGLPGKTPGDLFVKIEVFVPPATDDDPRAFYEAMALRFADFRVRGEASAPQNGT